MKTINIYKTIALTLTILTNSLMTKPLYVITTSTDLASIANSILGDAGKAESLTAPNTDLHYVQARPDYILKASKADVLAVIGLQLEIAWIPAIFRQARNSSIARGNKGYCDVSQRIKILQKPKGIITRAMGDIHIQGNPHYWTDPMNGILIARNFKDCFTRVRPEKKAIFDKNYQEFRKDILILTSKLLRKFKPYREVEIVAYHNEFIYLAQRLKLKLNRYVEALPGVTPSPSQIEKISNYIKKKKIKIIILSPWSNKSYARKVASLSRASLIRLPIETGSREAGNSYHSMIEKCYMKLLKALQ